MKDLTVPDARVPTLPAGMLRELTIEVPASVRDARILVPGLFERSS